MKNARNNGQKRVKNCLKWTASGLLLALMFVLVFAGTLSGAFGIENELQQNGIIENNVASAAGTTSVSGFSEYLFKFSDFNHNSENGTSMGQDRGIVHVKNSTRTTRSAIYSYVSLTGDILKHIQAGASVTATLSFYGDDSGNADKWGAGILSRQPKYGDVKTDSNYWADSTAAGFYNRSVINDNTGPKNTKSASVKLYDPQEQPTRITSFYVGLFVKADYAMDIGFHDIKLTFTYSYDYPVTFSATTGGTVSNATDNITGSNGNVEKKATSTASVATLGYHFVNWTKGNTSTEYSQNTTIEIGSSDFFEYDSYKANFALNRLNVVYWQNHTETDNTTWTDTFTYTQPKAFRNLPKNGDKTFVGWSTSRNGAVVHGYNTATDSGMQSIGNTSFLPVENDNAVVNLYAVWVDSDFGVLTGHTADETWGTINNPFVIKNAQHLINLSDIVNDRRDPVNSVDGEYFGANINTAASNITFAGCYFVVAADLGTADAQIALVPIGKDGTHYFAGTIFGGNDSDATNRTQRTIYLNVSQSGVNNVGLFGYVEGATATISHLTTAGTIVGGAAVGGLVGYADGVTISNCRNNASVTGAYMIGGLVGFGNNVTITSSVNNADITGEYNKAGTPSGLTKGAYVGGFVGVVNGGSIANCYNNGNISASGDNSDFLGGIAGYTTAPISYCVSLEAKTIEGSNQVGGIVGKASGNNAKIENCYFGGKINGLWNDNRAKLDFICAEKENGSTVSNSWKLSSAMQGATGNRKYTNAGHSIQASAFSLSPSYFDGTEYTPYTAVDGWQNILTVNINAFQILGGTESGKFLALHDGSNNSTLPNKTVIGKEKNSTGSPAKTDLVVHFIVYYNADTKQDVVAELKSIEIDAAAVDYNATEQYVVDNTQLPTTVNTHYFKQSFYFDQNGGGNATLGKTNAGTYKVYSDVWIRANGTDYLVGRKESTWTIKKLKFTIDNNQFFYGQDIENAIKNQIVIKNQSNVSVPKGAYTVVFGFNDTEHNFYGSIDIDQNQKEFIVAKTIISIYDSSNTLINDNFDINGFSVIVKAGDFGVQNNDINKSNIENNQWGSESNPYIIGTRDQLVTLSNIVRGATNATNSWYTSDVYKYVKGTIASYGGAYFKLARSLTSIGNITPIGTSSNVFSATFDGNNNTISGLNISVAGNNVGLFGYISGATIKYLTVNGSVKGSSNVGGVVGYALNSTIEDVTNNASISSTYKDAPYEIKQFDAHPYDANEQAVSKVNDGDLNSKYYSAKKGAMSFIVQNTTLAYIFGFAITNANDTNNTSDNQKRTPQSVIIWGSNNDFQRDNYTSGGGNTTIPNEWGWEVVYNSTLAMPSTNSYRKEFFSGFKLRNYKYYYIYVKAANNYSTLQFAEFDLLTTNSQNVGGVVGYANGTNIKNATNNASVEGDTSVGGIVGHADSTSRMYGTIVNSGNITANSMVGGVSGENHGFWCDTNSNYGTFKNSGSINGRNGATVGGVTAFADKEMCNAENTGNVIGGNAVGGVAGRVQAPIKNSYNSGEIVGTNPTAQGEISGTLTGVFVGGITGYTTSVGTISNCYNKGHIAAHSASGDYINNGDYVGGIVGFAQAKVEYCANIGGLIEGNNFIGGIVGNALDNTNIDYCYDVQGQRKFRWDGCNHGSITGSGGNVTNSWAINEKQVQTTANNPNPVVSTKGYRLTTAFAVTPQVDLQNTTNQKWEDILSSKINGFKVVGSVAKNKFFCSDNGTDATYVKPSKTEGFVGDNGDVAAWYSATIESNIRVRVQNIDIDNKSSIYDKTEHTFDFTSKPSQSANSANVYAVQFAYLGRDDGDLIPKDVDVYDTTITVKIGDQVVGVKTGVTYTIEKATLNVGWKWTDNLHANLYDRTGDGDKVQFVYNGKGQGLSYVSPHLGDAALFYVTSNDLTKTDAATYTLTYTLKDTRNYKLNFTNNNTGLSESATSVEFKWTIRKNKLTVSNYWTGADLNPSGEFYTFEYNATHQGLKLQDGITFDVEPDTLGSKHDISTGAYEIETGVERIAANTYTDTYTRTFTIKGTTNYEVGNRLSFNTSLLPNQKGSAVNAEKSIVTYTWKIVPYSLATNISNVWFGGTTNLIVGNQGIANVKVGNANEGYYPLQADKKGAPGVQQVLVYSGHNYAPANFVLYVKYNNGTVVKLTRDTEYTVGTLDIITNTFGTFNVNVVSQANPVEDTNVTARGTGNFSGDITKYYTALYSDFGGNVTGANWGSADNPYVISKPEHLLRLSQIVNGGIAWNSINTTDNALCISPQGTAVATDRAYSGAYFLVTADIDMTGNVSTDGVYNFLPIGHRNEQSQTDMPFSGTFDGNGKKIKFVYNVNRNNFYNNNKAHSDYVGLFGYIAGYKVDAEQRYATIKNLSIESMDGNEVDDNGGIIGKDYVGGIAGYAVDSKLYNVSMMYGSWVRGENYVGGIVGYADNTWLEVEKDYGNAITNANVGGMQYVGGIVGKWIVRSEDQIGGDAAGQAKITLPNRQQIHGVKYVGGLVGWLDTSSCTSKVEYTPQLNNNGEKVGVTGTEYVGALFGALIGNGYHKGVKPEPQTGAIYTAIGIDSGKVNNITLGTRYSDGDVTYQSKVVGGLVGYVESAGLVFVSDWNTANIAFDLQNVQDAALSFFGGIVGVLGQNATMEALYEIKADGTYLFGGSRTITNDTTFGASNPLGSFVGGIVGYVSSQAGTYWDSTTTIFGNGIALVNSANIYAKGYVGGIFGALGDISENVAQTFENDKTSILYKVLTTGVRKGNANTTLGIAPATTSEWVGTAVGKLHNTAGVSATDKYVGGIAGYSGAKVRFVLRNTPQTGAIATENLNVYSGGNDIYINGSYAGGIAGYLVDNLEHELQYIVVQAKFESVNAKRVGGLVGYMGSGKVENCVVTNGGNSNVNELTDTFKGSEYVGGLVGETQNAIITNSVSTGFNLDKTTNTKGGLLGGGTNPTIEASWTFYIAQSKVAEEPGVAENKKKYKTTYPTYSTVSKNTYGEYVLVDNRLYKDVTFVDLCKFAGITQGATAGILEFSVDVPGANKTGSLKNKQLAFYDASGSDTETSNKESFKGFDNSNNVLTVKLDMESGTSMQICVADIEFVNVPQHGTDNDEAAHAVVESTYKKPSNSTRYHVDVTQANFDIANTKQVTYIKANVYFECNGTLTVISDGVYLDLRKVGDYDSGTLTPGSQENPYTISNQKEWNDFAYSVYTGTDYTDKYVKLLTDEIVINTGTNGSGMHEGTKGSHNFGSVQAIPSAGQNAPLTDANGNAVDRNNIGYNFAGDISHDGNVNNFHGTFDGNGHYITVNYGSGGFHRVSVFPNAAGATFRNLTIKGYIQAASQMTGANGIANSAAYDVAGFVGKPFGTLKFYNCTNEADIIGLRNVAGLVGYNAGGQSITLEACVNTGDITSLEGSYTLGGINKKTYSYDDGWNNQGYGYGTGGIIGSYTGTLKIESCRNAGTIIGGHNVGGIIGLHNGTSNAVVTIEINNCANTGNITSNSGYWNEDEGGVEGSTSTGVRQNIFGYAGGIVGKTGQYSILKMYASYNTGTILTLSNMSGGLAGGVGSFYFKSAGPMNAIQTGGRSEIVYCYNTGDVYAGGTFPKITSAITDFIFGSERENIGGTISGGFVGCAGNIQISQGYNAGNIWNFGHISYDKSWQIRAAGIVGQSEPVTESNQTGYVLLDNLYNVGTLSIRPIDYSVITGHTVKNNMRYGAAISGYIDKSDRNTRVKAVDCYSINNCISSRCAVLNGKDYKYYKNGLNSWNPEYRDQWYQNSGVGGIGSTQVDLIETGRVYSTYDALTAAMDENSRLRMTGTNFAFGQSTTALSINYGNVNNYTYLLEQIIANDGSISESSVSNLSSIQWKNFPDSWLYVYGCLPQLSVFALDTQNGLSMRSVGYGKDVYDEYNENGLPAGSEQYPYIIKDGVDLMGMQALVDAGYSFEGKYIEVADGKNNRDGLASKRIKLSTYDSTDTAATNDASNTMYKAVDQKGAYRVGKSYHLLLQGAIFNKAYNKGENPTFVGSDYASWAWNTYYYNGGYRDNEWTDSGINPNKFYNYGGMRQLGIFTLQNFIPMGRGSSVFKGHFSGEQANGENTTIDDVRITTGKYGTTTEYGSEYGGLFAKVQDAYIGYISIGGSSKIWSFTKENDISACGGIVGLALGDTVIDNCGIEDTAEIGSYGVSKTNEYVILDNGKIVGSITNGNFAKATYAGGIVGMADPKQGNTYNAGITTTIRNCSISSSGRIESAKSNIGGVLGYVGGDAGASGKGNTVRIERCEVQKAAIQAASSATESSHIGGVLGYGSDYVAAFITGCEVGNSADTTDTVTIKGEHSLGGIAGGMSNAKGGYIDSCTVGAKTSIERINQGGGNISENPKHGTAIGGLVGFTEDSTDTTSPLTTTFSGTSKFLGTINVTVGTTNPGEHGDKKPVGNVGGIVGDMGSGANFASGSEVEVRGNINVTLEAANIGGVAGRTNKATFIGKFNVAPNMSTENAENVGGFIGKNVGTVYILADTTERIVDGKLNSTNITIGGTIRGTSEVGGFIGVNNSGSSLNIGSNVANAKPYKSGTLSITIAEGAEISGSGDNVGGIVGKNEGAVDAAQNDYATIDIVKGTIVQKGTISGKNYVGGIIGLNAGLLTTGGGEADTSIGGVNLSDAGFDLLIKKLSIINNGNVKGGAKENNQDVGGDCVGGVIGWLDAPQTLRPEHMGKGDIAGAFTNSGSVEGNRFVGGSLGYVGKYVNIATKGGVNTLFVNTGNVTAHSTFVGGSIGAIVGKITGAKVGTTVNFENQGTVNGLGYVGGSIGVLAGQTQFAQFVNSSKKDFTIDACNSVGGSVGYIGMPDALKTILNTYFKDNTYSNGDITVKNVHFEASGNLTANPSDDTVNAAKNGVADNDWGGVGGAIGVLGRNQLATWENNTYYANGNVIAQNVNNVGGIVGLINANDITIGNLLAYNIIVTGAKNVGGIVGATNGTNTKILSAYTIEGTFSATENVGGIIGLANSTEGVATDAKTSYWVKGYSNAVLAGADVKDLQQTLGKFETIVEQVTVEGKQQTIVFTEDFCKLYTPKTYYADYPGTHTYNGETVTPGENVEQLTWDDYFKTRLGETSAQIKNGAWVKTVANAVTFTTGTEKTGWYFAFANDATGAYGLGTINTNHHKDGGDYELKYWKRIANAYTAQERADKIDTQPLDPPSDIVSGGQPIQSTLYATATAAGEDSGYYLYMATSGQSRPTATYSTNKFFIQVLTTTTTQAELAQNVAIYYRTISKGKTLTYNGYLRYAPVGITVDDGKTVPYVQTPQQDAAKKDSYCYSADTTTGGNATGGAQIDPGNYESAVKIYYYDKDGKPYVVGGVSIKWEIKARQLSADIKSDPYRVYGDNRNQDDGHDMKVVISNIAPGAGTPPQFVITVTDKSSNPNVVTTVEYNGNTLSETKNGITLTATSVGNSSNNEWEASDNLYNVEEPTDKNTKDVLFYIDFTNAKTYEVSVAMEQGDWIKRYTLDAKKDFSVNPAPLDLTRSNPASEKYDGTAKSATWFISGFKYQDGAKEFAAFQPQFKTALGKTTDPKVVTLYNLYKGTATSGYTLETNITLERPGETVSYGEKVENQSKTISYTLSGATQAGDYSIVFPSTGSSITVGNYTLKFYEGASPQTKPPVFSIAENKITISISYVDSTKQHPYNGQKKGKITITFEADNEIAGYGDYISNFFKASINNGGKEISKPSGTTSGKTAQWVFETGVDVKDYKVTISDGVNHTEYVKNCAHDAYPNNIIYKITKAPLTVNFEPSGSTTYEYNTYHQGLSAVKLSGLYQNIDNGNKYDSVAITIIFNNNSYAVTINKNNSAVDVTNYINTRNVGNYTATIANSVGGAKGSNYYISNTSVSTSWTITPHVLKLDGLEQDGTKIYDGAAVTPKLTVGGNNVTNGKTTYNDDTIQIKYSATLNGVAAKGIVNAGIYNISIGGSSAENAIKATRDGEDTTKNYTISGTDSATYTISKRPITVTWNMSTLKFVYDLTPHGLTVSGITGGGVGATLQSSSLDTAIVKTGYGNDVIKFTLQGKKVDAGKNYEMSIANSALNGIIVNDEVESTIDNYVISGTTCEKKFEIEKSQIIIKYAGGTTTKVYDAGFGISGTPFEFRTESRNQGADGTSELFTIRYEYKDKNVGDNKEVVFTYVLKDGNANYEYVGTGTESQNKGQITPAHIKVALDKLRSGKATRTFTNNEWYGGQAGASSGEKDGKSTVYRSGEGFRVSGVFSSDDIKVVAKYAEAGDDRAMFDKYVNDIVKNADETFAKAKAGTHLKMLVFEMTGDDAKNYTFNVYNKLGTDGKKYSEKDSTAGDKQTVTVYDTDDKANGHQNANGAEQIKIEITVKTYKVEYTNTAQSYANADNTYNTNWERVGVSNNPPGVTVTVSNGWMYADGQDHGDDEQAEKKVYKAYTTIRGSQNSVLLGAKISGIDGMELNYKMVNQPILTIGYFVVDNNDVFEIGSASSLMIASYYWWVAQNGQNPDFNLPLVATSTWHKIVSNDDYMTKPFEKPSDAPNDVDMTGWDWDMYFAWFEQQYNVKIFLNETGISNEDGTWGYYTTGEESQQKQYTKYRMVRDFSGKLTESDIAILEAFFPKEKGWGVGKTYLDNFLNTSVGSVLTAVGSVFRWYNGSVGQFEFDGNGYVIEYLNIMGYGKENVGLFDIIGANGIVKNLHLRNITINANQGNVGGIAGSIAAADGDADATKNVTNVSFHGKITATGGTVGGLFGTSARAIDGAIVLGEISATGANAGGVVGTATADLTKVVSMMQITASGGTVGAFTSDNAHVGENCTHMTNTVWKKGTSGTGFVNVKDKNVGYNDLMLGSNSLYANGTFDSGTYDVISETFADSGQNVNPRQSKRLRDMVSVYLLMYSLSANGGTYTISSSSWLVGTADGTNAKPIVIANKQNVSLLRELRFAAFVLKANVSIDIASTFSGAFYGSVTSAVNESGVSYGYKITCNKPMFEAYATEPPAWLVTPTQP